MGKNDEEHVHSYQSYSGEDPMGQDGKGREVYMKFTHYFCRCGDSYNVEHGTITR